MEITRYIVRINGTNVNQAETERGAIRIAKLYLGECNPENVSVIVKTISGSHVSTMQVWPTVGEIYTN